MPTRPDPTAARPSEPEPLRLDSSTTTAPSEQIRTQIAARISHHIWAAGTRLPTVRSLATDLGVAANTVAKAYRKLETDGLISTDGRRGSFVSSSVVDGSQPAADIRLAADGYATAARRAGLSLPEALRLVEDGWRST